MTVTELFLPGVPADHVLARLKAAGGHEVGSGKLDNPDSSAALAVNTFGWFVDRDAELPPFPTISVGRAEDVEVEYPARFPWSGGMHPCLDAIITTPTHHIGVESKRFEPFRGTKQASFSEAYDRPVWGANMERYGAVRDALRTGELRFRHLDAVQLVKHAYGLVTDGKRIARRPVLFYLFAEPAEYDGRPVAAEDHARHRDEITAFAAAVRGDEVEFGSASYREWLATWPRDGDVAAHADAITRRFHP